MTKARDFKPLIDSIAQLRRETVKKSRRDIPVSNEFYEWHIDHEVMEDDPESKENERIFEDFPIKRIRLLVNKHGREEAILDVTYKSTDDEEKNPRKQIIYVPVEKYAELKKNIAAAGIKLRKWNMLGNITKTKLDWGKLREHYEHVKADKNYSAIHAQMLIEFEKELKILIQKNPDLPVINLVDIGCGQAPTLLKAMYDIALKLKPRHTSVRALGVDEVQSNVDVCNHHPYPAEIKFIQGDSNNIDNIIKTNSHLIQNENAMNFVFSSGSISRFTLKNAFEATHVLQASWRAPVHLLIAGAQTELLFNRRMLKRIGFKDKDYEPVISVSDFAPPVVSMKRIPPSVMMKKLQKAVHKKSILDLSLNPNPEEILADFKESKEVKKIDLSFSNILEAKSLAASLQSFPNLDEVTFYFHDFAKAKLLIPAIPFNKKISFNIRYTENERHLFASREFFKRKGEEIRETGETFLCEFKTNVINEFIQSVINQYPTCNSIEQQRLLECVDLLVSSLEEKPNLFEKDVTYNTILFSLGQIAEEKKQSDLCHFVASRLKSTVFSPIEFADAAVYLVKANNRPALISFLKDCPISLAELCQLNSQILNEALKHENKELLLLCKNAGVNFALTKLQGEYGVKTTIVQYVMKFSSLEMLNFVLDTFPELVDLPDQGWTPVMREIREQLLTADNAAKLSALIEHKADITKLNPYGTTPMHDADTVEKIRILVNAGADFMSDVIDNSGQTPFQGILYYTLYYAGSHSNNIKEALDLNPDAWSRIFLILTSTDKIDVNNPYFNFKNSQVSLKQFLSDFTDFMLMRMLNQQPAKMEQMLNLFIQTAEKYHCDEALLKLANRGLYTSNPRGPAAR